MKRSDWIIWWIGAALLTLVLIVTGCRTSYEAEGATHATASDSLDTQGRTVTESTTTAPVRIVTETTRGNVHRIRTVELAPVTSTTTSDLKSQERADSTLDEQHKEKHSFDFLHGPFALIGGLVILVVVVYVAVRIFKPGFLP